MKIYFLSARPCALTLNDTYFGITDTFERFAEISLKDRTFVRFAPEGALPIGFFLTENIRFTPPTGCEVYLLKDGIAIYAYDFPPADLTLRPIAQKRIGELLITVFSQGNIQLSIQSPQGFFTATLPPSFASCEIEFHGGLLFLKSPNQLAIYTKTGERVFLETVLSFTASETEFSVSLPLSDLFGRIADCTFSLSDAGITRTAFSLKQARTLHGDNTPEKVKDELLPYAFFTSVLIGANCEELLCAELAPKANIIKEFLGDFIAVVPTQDTRVCGLVKKKSERLFEVAYFTAEVENGRIFDVKG